MFSESVLQTQLSIYARTWTTDIQKSEAISTITTPAIDFTHEFFEFTGKV
jgi:hypothetical protein